MYINRAVICYYQGPRYESHWPEHKLRIMHKWATCRGTYIKYVPVPRTSVRAMGAKYQSIAIERETLCSPMFRFVPRFNHFPPGPTNIFPDWAPLIHS